MPRLFYIVPHRADRSPSQRYRLEQFFPWFRQHGWEVVYANLLDERDDRVFYASGNLPGKLRILVTALFRRWRQVRSIRPDDVVIIHREAFMTRGLFFEKAIRSRAKHLVFDFDDSIWRMDVSEANKRLRWLKDPGKTGRIIAMADRVVAGNEYLADFARGFNKAVEVIPTTIDTELYRPLHLEPEDGRVVIGWTGSHTSMAYLEQALPVLYRVQAAFGGKVVFRVISDKELVAPGLSVQNVRWSSATEVQDLAAIDIGIMPMPDNEWSRGKCGFKGLQYMGMGKAVILADVGVNRTIVTHGTNGLLAASEDAWVEQLCHLVKDAELRRRSGAEARRTVEEHWSVHAWRKRYLDLFQELLTQTTSDVRSQEHRAHPGS
jgi:glycosyltransferase involved in cell wall biosynthesis